MMAVTILAAAAMGVGVMTSCTSTSRMRKIEATGFLGDYAQLKPGADGQAQLLYIKPGVNWASYNKIMIDPIKAYAIPGNPLAELPKDQLQALVNYLYVALHEEIGQDFKVVNVAGPGVLRLRVAITEAKAGKPVMGVASSLTPPGIAISTLKTVATGQGTGVGSARIEMELLDAQTKGRLAAAVDGQAGNKRDFFGNFNKWDDAQDAFDTWAARLRTRLAELRAGAKSNAMPSR
jgi:hypothetical protein